MLSPFPSASASLRDLSQTILAYANSHGWHGREYPGRERRVEDFCQEVCGRRKVSLSLQCARTSCRCVEDRALIVIPYIIYRKMEENKKNQPQFQIQLKPEVAGGQYANFALITHSKTEFVIDFAQLLPGMPGGQVCSRIIQAPEHAKRLLAALQENIYKYERQFGKIEITDQPPRTIAPFSSGMGKA